MYEAMERLRFEAFLDTLDENKKQYITSAVSGITDCFPDQTFVDSLEYPEMTMIYESYDSFIQESCKKSRTFAFWTMSIKMTSMCHFVLLIYF